MNRLLISIIESVYLFFMFHFFETGLDFNMGNMSNYDSYELRHLKGDEHGLRICPFGRKAILLLIFLLIIRNFYEIQAVIFVSLFVSFVLSLLMNLNALVYLLPVWIIEFWLYRSQAWGV